MTPLSRAVAMQDGGKLEIFCGSNRFLCVTGNALEGHNRKPTLGALDALLEQFKPQPEPEPESEDVEEGEHGECPAWITDSLHETTEPDRSEAFYACVGALKDDGWRIGAIEGLFREHAR